MRALTLGEGLRQEGRGHDGRHRSADVHHGTLGPHRQAGENAARGAHHLRPPHNIPVGKEITIDGPYRTAMINTKTTLRVAIHNSHPAEVELFSQFVWVAPRFWVHTSIPNHVP